MERGLFKHHALPGAGESCTAPPENRQNGGIALQGLLRQAGDGHTAGHSAQHGRKSRLAVIALHGVITGKIVLPAGNFQRVLIQPAALHAKGVLHRAGHIDVAPALHRRDEVQGAGAAQQGQGKQQPADELAGHVARQLVFARRQGTFHGQAVRALLKTQALLLIQRFVDRLGPLHQPPTARKSHFLPGQAGQRDEEAQGTAALTAVHGGINRQKAAQPFHHRVVFTGGDTGAQSARRAQRGGDILAESKMMEMGGPLCQRRAEHRPVSHAFTGRRGDVAAHRPA